MNITMNCPYCGNIFTYRIDLHKIGHRPVVVLCDTEETNGCDRYFVATIQLKAVVQTSKIAGEEV